MKEVKGNINIDYSVDCPHCGYYHDDFYDKEWFNETMGYDFPVDDGYKQKFEAKCKQCKEPFIINHFIH